MPQRVKFCANLSERGTKRLKRIRFNNGLPSNRKISFHILPAGWIKRIIWKHFARMNPILCFEVLYIYRLWGYWATRDEIIEFSIKHSSHFSIRKNWFNAMKRNFEINVETVVNWLAPYIYIHIFRGKTVAGISDQLMKQINHRKVRKSINGGEKGRE